MKTKIGVIGAQCAVLCAFAITQGCVTSESGRLGAAARNRGPIRHVHAGKTSIANAPAVDMPDFSGSDGGVDFSPEVPVFQDLTGYEVPAPVVTPPANEIYIVQKGDILSRIAVKFDTTTSDLASLNNLSDPNQLYIGQELRVPAGRGAGTTTTSSSSKGSSVQKGEVYVIQPGDTLSEIAAEAGVSVSDLRSLNNISGDAIWAGKEIYIPKGGKVPTKRSSSSASSHTATKTTSSTSTARTPVIKETTSVTVPPVQESSVPAGVVIEPVVVYPGETLDSISEDYRVSKSVIMSLNGISDESEVYEGMTLRVPVSE